MPVLSNISIPPIVVDPRREPLERLASGRRLNRFDDDPAGYAVATGMDARARSRRVVARNIRDATTEMLRVDQALQQMTDRLVRMREMALVALTDSTPRSARLGALFSDFWTARVEFNSIARRTPIAGRTVAGGFTYQVGVDVEATPDSILSLTVPGVSSATINDGNGNTLNSAWIGNDARSRISLDIIDNGMRQIGETRAIVGSFINRLEHAHNVNDVSTYALEAARSNIEDADMAVESARLTRAELLRGSPDVLRRLVRDLDEAAVRQLLAEG